MLENVESTVERIAPASHDAFLAKATPTLRLRRRWRYTVQPGSAYSCRTSPVSMTWEHIWEWTEDCLRLDCIGAPANGLAWLQANRGDCSNALSADLAARG